MKRLTTFTFIVTSCTLAFAKEKPKMKVIVIQNLPTTSSYSWQVDGRSSASCSGASCSAYYSPASSGNASVRGAVLKLLLPDGRIVIAACAAKQDVGRNLGAALAGEHTSTMYRNCRMPTANATIEAEFNRSDVKLFIQAASIDGTGKVSTETYQIKGVLEPTASTVLAREILGDPDLKKQLQTNSAEGQHSDAAAAASIASGTQLRTRQEQTEVLKSGQASRCIIATTPGGAEIYIDGNRAGKSPMAFALIRHGDTPRVLTIKLAGYMPIEKDFVPDGKDIALDLKLEQASDLPK